MSKDLVVQEMVEQQRLADSQLAHYPRSEKIVALPAEAFTGAVVSEETAFTPPVRPDWIYRTRKLTDIINIPALIVFVNLLGVMPVYIINSEFGGSGLAVGTNIFAGAISLGLFSSVPRWVKSWKQQIEGGRINAKALKSWLLSRYGIEVSHATLVMITDESYRKFAGRKTRVSFSDDIEFFDVEFRKFILVLNKVDGKSFHVVEKVKFGDESSKVKVLPEVAVDAVFSGEAQVLFDSIMSKVDVLVKKDLGVESKHVLSRIQNDLRQAIQLNNELVSFGDSDSPALVSVLSGLRQEVTQLFEDERSEVEAQLEVQSRYIKARQRISSDNRLIIVAGLVEVSSVNESVEVVGNV